MIKACNSLNFIQKFIALFCLMAILTTSSLVQANQKAGKQHKKVVVYGTSWCGYCKKTRSYLKSMHVPFTDYDIEHSPSARKKYEALGGHGVPLILVGSERIDGFNMDELRQALIEHGLIKDQ